MMHRRDFLATAAAAPFATLPLAGAPATAGHTYASPADAMKAPPEKIAYVSATYAGTPGPEALVHFRVGFRLDDEAERSAAVGRKRLLDVFEGFHRLAVSGSHDLGAELGFGQAVDEQNRDGGKR